MATFIPGVKVVNEKKVREVLGEAFDYKKAFDSSSAFCKKHLTFCARGFSTENILFVLVCEKYKVSPSREMFDKIYNEFIDAKSAPRMINVSGIERIDLKTVFEAELTDPPTVPPMTVFNSAVGTIRELVNGDTLKRLKDELFSTAFTLDEAQKLQLDDAIKCLKDYNIYLI